MNTDADVAVLTFFSVRGWTSHAVFLDGTDVFVGRRVANEFLQLVYRVERDHLIICELSALGPSDSLHGAVAQLVALLKTLLASVPQIVRIRGMVLPSVTSIDTNRARARMVRYFESMGAYGADVAGDRWLVFERPDLSPPCGSRS